MALPEPAEYDEPQTGASEDLNVREATTTESLNQIKSILGELTDVQANNLLRLASGDINLAVAMYFDNNGAADDPTNSAGPAPHAGGSDADDVFAHLAVLREKERAGPQTPRGTSPSPSNSASADRGPSLAVADEPRDDSEHGLAGNGVDRPRRRRPGTAPPSRQRTRENDAEFQVKAEAMRSVLGADVSDEVLRHLLHNTGGDVQLALESFFDHDVSDSFVFVGADSVAGVADDSITQPPPEPALVPSGARRRQQRQHDQAGPRKPFEDLAGMLGGGVKAHMLGPIMVEVQGDVSKALELYCDRHADPKFRQGALQNDPVVSAELLVYAALS